MSRRYFKVQKNHRKIGIACISYKDLLLKCRNKFSLGENIILKLEDGTEIDEDFFEVLENNEELLIDYGNTFSRQILSRLEKFLLDYNEISNNDIHESLQEILSSQGVSEMLYALVSLHDQRKFHYSSRNDDEKWFVGLNTKYKTKEDVLRNSAESRMRGYFQKLKKELENLQNLQSFQVLKDTIHQKLKLKKYNANYFDRSVEASGQQLCDSNGSFRCFGDFQSISCSHCHIINPYKSREDRIIFSTWNLDHVIEKSRSIIPAVKKALEESPICLNVDCDYLFELLFEHKNLSKSKEYGNLKLVHIVCHNKNPHNLLCDTNRLTIKETFESSEQKKMKYN